MVHYHIIFDLTAADQDYTALINHQFILSDSSNKMISICLENDRIYELTESFEVNLSLSDDEPSSPRVFIGQASAEVIILDDDGQSCVSMQLI